jgi:hypothetical protein
MPTLTSRKRLWSHSYVTFQRAQTLGNIESGKLRSNTRSWSPFESSTLNAIYDTQLARGAAEERFVWRKRDSVLRLVGYYIALPN